MRVERSEIVAACEKGPRAVVRLVNKIAGRFEKGIDRLKGQVANLENAIELSREENRALTLRVAELEARLNTNSRNSSKPPSSDGLSKPPSTRKKTGKPPGGRKGHPGHTLLMVADPDREITHEVTECAFCGRSLEAVEPDGYERRQVFDIPPVRMEVTEHGAQRKTCPECGRENRAAFPAGVAQPARYGPRLRAAAVYMNDYQLTPYKRTGEMFSDLFGCRLSEGTLVNWSDAASRTLEPMEAEIKRMIASENVADFDETGTRVGGRGEWLHVASTEKLTHYGVHDKRGRRATDDIGILPEFSGTAVHDCWSPYLTYDCSHALCGAHLIRELTFQAEESAQEWALEMIDLLLEAKAAVDEAKGKGRVGLKPSRLEDFEKRYEAMLAKGFAANPLPDARGQPARRGRKKKTKARNLLERLRDYQCEVLAFMNDFSVPFTNNLAEADLRMAKVKQKISGAFRSWDGASDFCRIRGYISTARKNAIPVIEALASVFEGEPLTPVDVAP